MTGLLMCLVVLSVLCPCSACSHAHAAVDGQPGAGDEAGRVGGEEDHRVGHVGDLAQAALRGETNHRADGIGQAREQADVHDVLSQLVAHLGRDQAGVDAVHPDGVAEPAGLGGRHPGQPVDCRFRRGVDRDARKGDRRGDRRDVDHGAAAAGRAAGAHGAEGVLDAERGAEDVDLEHLADVVRVEVDDQAGNLDAGVVDHDVHAAELGDRARDASLPAVVVGDVQREERGVTAGFLDRVDGGLAEFLADVADDDGRAGPGQRLGHPGAEAARPAGDQGLASGQVVHAHVHLLLETALAIPGRCDVGHIATGSGQSSRLSWTIVKLVLGADGGPRYSWVRPAGRGRIFKLTGSHAVTDVDQGARVAAAVPAETNRERVSRRQVDKFAERRAQLADAALQTLAELGYARTSLREIAQNSQFSHGVLHYYFSDKEDLITHCVRQYEAACVTRYDEIVAAAASAEELKREFSAAMAQTLRTDAPMHRLWYDLRNQSLFEESFRADVLEIDQRREEMIWRVISRYASFAGVTVSWSPAAAYAILDGLFQQALLHHLAGDPAAAQDLAANVTRVLDTLEGREGRPESFAARP